MPVLPVLRVADCSGSCGDRASALYGVVNDGPVDVVTGDGPAALPILDLRTEPPARGLPSPLVGVPVTLA